MNTLKQHLANLVEANATVKANPSVILIHLVKAIYADENPSNARLIRLCGLNEKTYYRNAKDIEAVARLTPHCPPHGVHPTVGVLPTLSYPPCPTHGGSAEQEEERKVPPTPPIKKEEEEISPLHSEISLASVRACVCEAPSASSSSSLSQVLASFRSNFDAYGNPIADPNVPADTVVNDDPKALKYEAEFEYFYAEYPKRQGLQGGIAKIQLRNFWKALERDGWDGRIIKQGFDNALLSERWLDKDGRFIPRAFNFLRDEEFRMFLPAHLRKPNASTPAPKDAIPDEHAFNEVLRIYPKRKGIADNASMDTLRATWKNLITEIGYESTDIIRALKDAIHSKRWTDDNGRTIPTLQSFLADEVMLEFLPTGFKPKSRSLAGKPTQQVQATWTPRPVTGEDDF